MYVADIYPDWVCWTSLDSLALASWFFHYSWEVEYRVFHYRNIARNWCTTTGLHSSQGLSYLQLCTLCFLFWKYAFNHVFFCIYCLWIGLKVEMKRPQFLLFPKRGHVLSFLNSTDPKTWIRQRVIWWEGVFASSLCPSTLIVWFTQGICTVRKFYFLFSFISKLWQCNKGHFLGVWKWLEFVGGFYVIDVLLTW